MTAAGIIRRKRDGHPNTAEEIAFMVSGALSKEVPAYQLSAWLMAVFFRGMTEGETMTLTRAFIESGTVVDFDFLPAAKVDKHSTGGVGDKTSLVVAPVAAAAGVAVPMISGRGLGHTGGTLDKLEAIPGFRTDLALREFRDLVGRHGLCLIGATDQLAPADRLFYGLRDVTATVESIPLIVASILSKKVAEGIDALVLDVKTGRGAFMKSFEDSLRLAESLVAAGNLLGKKTVAVVSDMSQPLGLKVGNALEVRESIECLMGRGPRDLTELSLELAAHMIRVGSGDSDLSAAREKARQQLDSGNALAKFREMVQAQGGDPAVVDDPTLLSRSRGVFEYVSPTAGFVVEARAEVLGRVAMLLGAGRKRVDDKINPAVGLSLQKKIGDRVENGEPLAALHYDDRASLEEALAVIPEAFQVGAASSPPPALVQKVIE